MSANVEVPSVKKVHSSQDLPTFETSFHGSPKRQSDISKDAPPPHGIPRTESNGIISSIMSVAHNAANMIKTKHEVSVESFHDQLSPKASNERTQRLVSISRLSKGLGISINGMRTTDQPETPENVSLSPSNVHFEPVRHSPIHTLGEGDLSLFHFEKKDQFNKPSIDVAEVPVKGGPFVTESSSNKLRVSGTPDSKIIRRKSISNSSIADSISSEGTIDTNGADSHTFDPSEFSNLDLEQILDSPNKLHVQPKKDREFHNTFKKIPTNEHLLADFSCALSRDILVQGKMYLSPNYICFNSNILGWVTNIVVPIQEIIQIEKKSTAVLFPNGMVIRTLHQKFVFATFLSRDTTFNLITQVWHNALQDEHSGEPQKLRRGSQKRRLTSRRSTAEGLEITNDLESDELFSGSEDEDKLPQSSDENDLTFMSKSSEKKKSKEFKKSRNLSSISDLGSQSDLESGLMKCSSNDLPALNEKNNGKLFKGFPNPGPATHPPTSFDHEKVDGEVEILQHTFNAPLGVVYNLLYGPDSSTFIKILEDGKNFDISKEKLTQLNDLQKEREYSYIKPLSGPIGPKQTKCNITETVHKYDLSSYCELEQVTKTPDVPLGNSFKVKTRFYFSWGPKNSTNVTVYTSVEWSAKSWIKLAVEKGSLDGQKTSMKVLVDTLGELISNGGSGATRKKRKGTKSGSQSTVKAVETPQEETKPQTLSSQILDIMEKIGLSLPVQIPMISNTATGGIVLFIISLLYSYILTVLLGGRSNLASLMAVSSDGKYILMSPLELYLRDELMRKQNEAQLWDWIVTRTGAESPDFGHAKAVNEKYADENFKEMMRMTKNRIDAAYLNVI